MNKKKLFIGSSSEAKDYLEKVETIFSNNFKVIRWDNPEVFSINNTSSLDSLIKQSYLVDFAIFIATADDLTTSREEKKSSPRDNILFEFGLFLQTLGKERCFLITEKNIKILSDMNGITLVKFNSDTFEYELKKVKENLLQRKKHIPSLVTTGLAYGYYKNFLKKLAEYDCCETLTIYIQKQNFDPNEFVIYKNHDLPVRQAFRIKKSNHYVDYPTTLDVIDEIIRDKNELSAEESCNYRVRELENFKIVLQSLMENESFKNKISFK